MTLSKITAGLFAALLLGGWTHGAAPTTNNGGGMLMGLGPVGYYTNGPPFLNWAQSGGSAGGGAPAYTINLVAGGTLSYPAAVANGQIDPATGELIPGAALSTISNIAKGIFTPPNTAASVPILVSSPWWNGLAMSVTWTGTSTVTISGSLGTGSTALSCGANSCTFTFGSNPVNFGLRFAVTDVNNPPKNIFVYETKFQTQVTALATCTPNVNCNHFSPDWLAVVSPFGRLRTMDWMAVNDSGPVDLTQMADFNYQICVACSLQGIASGTARIDNGVGGVGNTLTVTSTSAGSTWAVGQIISMAGITGAPTITALGTGTGSNGTYTISGAAQLVASTGTNGVPSSGLSLPAGSKGGVHPSVMVELARITRADIHYNLPVDISDQGMTDVAAYFRDNMPSGLKVFYEIGNENWNFGLGVTYFWLNVAAKPVFGGTANGLQYAGYRMSQLMAITQGVYGTNSYDPVRAPTSKWAGVIGGQMTSGTAVPAAFVTGFTTWQAAFSPTTKLYDLFNEIVVAPYFSDFPGTTTITAVSTGATTTVTAANSFAPGQVKRLYFSGASGLSAYNNLNVTIASANATSFTFSTFVTTGTFTNSGSNYVADGPLENMVDASNACLASSSASFTGTITGSALAATGVTGTIVLGQGVSGVGVPANTYINSGSAGTYVLNSSATVGPVAMTTAPCATKFQFFAQQWSKLMITGSNDFGYTSAGLIPITGFPAILATTGLYANSNGLALSEYEGGNQFVTSGYGSPNEVGAFSYNWQWDAAGNDPLYTPAKVYAAQFQMLRNINYSAYSAKYVEQYLAANFSGVRYLGDSNPSWSAILAENALGVPVDPTPPATGTYAYPGNGTNCASGANRCFTASACSSCTDSFTPTIGTAATKVIVGVALTGNALAPTVVCDGVTLTQDVISSGGRLAAIYSGAMASGTATRSCTAAYAGSGQSFQNREYYVATATGLNSATPLSTLAGANVGAINYTKGALLFTVGATSSGSYAATSGVGSGVTTTIASDIDLTSGRTAAMGMFSAPFSSTIFSVSQGAANAMAAAVYR